MENTQPLALLYVRVSTNRQAKTGHSLDSQPAILKEKAQAEGYRVEIVSETGSGRNSARPALNDALARLKRGEAHALYAVDTDRLARSTRHLLEIATAAKRQGWRLVITSNDVDTSTPAGELFLTMAAAFAQYESQMTGLRVKRQHEARRARGIIWGIDEGVKSALPDSTLERVAALSAQGLSLRAIGAALDAEGITTARGNSWGAQAVKNALALIERRSQRAA